MQQNILGCFLETKRFNLLFKENRVLLRNQNEAQMR
jgi:hypothetical protein